MTPADLDSKLEEAAEKQAFQVHVPSFKAGAKAALELLAQRAEGEHLPTSEVSKSTKISSSLPLKETE